MLAIFLRPIDQLSGHSLDILKIILLPYSYKVLMGSPYSTSVQSFNRYYWIEGCLLYASNFFSYSLFIKKDVLMIAMSL